MKIKLEDGRLWIDGKEVSCVLFRPEHGVAPMYFPSESTGEKIEISDDSDSDVSVGVIGFGNKVSMKNVNTGNVTCKGDFRLGDG